MGNQYAYQTGSTMSYVTGSHAFKVGMQTMTGQSELRNISPLYTCQYILRQRSSHLHQAGRVPAQPAWAARS